MTESSGNRTPPSSDIQNWLFSGERHTPTPVGEEGRRQIAQDTIEKFDKQFKRDPIE